MLDMVFDVFVEVLLDSLKMLPFLFLGFLALEYFEHRAGKKTLARLESSKKAGPVLGAAFGILPQCGFSIVASNLYAGGAVSVGTLIAVFISTSDEAIIVMLSEPTAIPAILLITGIKLILAVVFGYIADGVFRHIKAPGRHSVQAEHEAHCHSGCGCSCNSKSSFVRNAVTHTLTTFAFIFVISLALGMIIGFIGEDALGAILMTNTGVQPLAAGIVGLIPNCAASVVLAELYIEGMISIGALLTGLFTATGLGILALFKANKNLKMNIAILAGLYICGAIVGLIADFIA